MTKRNSGSKQRSAGHFAGKRQLTVALFVVKTDLLYPYMVTVTGPRLVQRAQMIVWHASSTPLICMSRKMLTCLNDERETVGFSFLAWSYVDFLSYALDRMFFSLKMTTEIAKVICKIASFSREGKALPSSRNYNAPNGQQPYTPQLKQDSHSITKLYPFRHGQSASDKLRSNKLNKVLGFFYWAREA